MRAKQIMIRRDLSLVQGSADKCRLPSAPKWACWSFGRLNSIHGLVASLLIRNGIGARFADLKSRAWSGVQCQFLPLAIQMPDETTRSMDIHYAVDFLCGLLVIVAIC